MKSNEDNVFDGAIEVDLDPDSDVGVARHCAATGALRPCGWLGLTVPRAGRYEIRFVVRPVNKERT